MSDKDTDRDYRAMAAVLWEQMEANEKTGVRFGMFPALRMKAAEADGFEGRKLSIALMEIAEQRGGMRA